MVIFALKWYYPVWYTANHKPTSCNTIATVIPCIFLTYSTSVNTNQRIPDTIIISTPHYTRSTNTHLIEHPILTSIYVSWYISGNSQCRYLLLGRSFFSSTEFHQVLRIFRRITRCTYTDTLPSPYFLVLHLG